MISMPLRMRRVMKRKLKKCVNRIHNGNPSCSVSSITRNSWRSIRQCEVRPLAIATPRQNGWRNVGSEGCVASAKSIEAMNFELRHRLHAFRHVRWQTPRNGVAIEKQNAGCRFLRFVIRHCSRCAAKTELCVTVISFEALVSFDSKVFTAYLSSRETSELAVDLNAFGANSKFEFRIRDCARSAFSP
jgi:hypothetical protein